ncbi:MAG: homing endonuclease associated repeat-containing protein [Candidatus Saccharimonadales bacterium]
MKFELEEYHRRVSGDELIADLKCVASDLGKRSVTCDEQDEKGKFHSTTFMRRFGSWFDALEKAELELTRTPMNLPEGTLFENLEEIWQKLGRQPRYAEMQSRFQNIALGHTSIVLAHGAKRWKRLLLL